ncbi:MAG: DegV family protein [Phototrophicaceae bacterium]|jgi:DegV family protein with EDD domain
MQLVTDRAADMSPEQINALTIPIHYVPFTLTLDGKDYLSGVDIQPDDFYKLLASTNGMPTTSLPSTGEVIATYRDVVAKTGDREIISVHLSETLSGTFNSARLAAQMAAEEGITVHVINTRTLGAPEGWQVEAAARAIMAGQTVDQIRALLEKISKAANCVYTLPTLKYLIHGGRISHISGLLASTLDIKPLIGVSYETGKYEQRGRVRTFKKAVTEIATSLTKIHPAGSKLRVQPLHGNNPTDMQIMMDAIAAKFDVEWMPPTPIAPILGAHTGSGMIGCAFARVDQLPKLP